MGVGFLATPQNAMWWKGQGKDVLPLPPVVGKGTDSPHTAATLRRVVPTPHLGSTVELTLLTGVQVNQPQECEHGISGPAVALICHAVV